MCVRKRDPVSGEKRGRNRSWARFEKKALKEGWFRPTRKKGDSQSVAK